MTLQELNPTTRFSDRVLDYDKYRPSYPSTLLDYLNERIGGLRAATIADIGAGTGIFSKLLLERGASVVAVEPNENMLAAARRNLSQFPKVRLQKGTAENTEIESASIDLITSAQAFHWFDYKKTRTEFDRILKERGQIALIWNYLNPEGIISKVYDEIKVKFSGEALEKVTELKGNVNLVFNEFFKKSKFQSRHFDNFQILDREGLIGRFFSSSYSPQSGNPLREGATVALQELFDKYQIEGSIKLEYKTELYLGC